MCYYILTQTCQVISQNSVQRITNLELELEKVRALCVEFDKATNERSKHYDMEYDGDKLSLRIKGLVRHKFR